MTLDRFSIREVTRMVHGLLRGVRTKCERKRCRKQADGQEAPGLAHAPPDGD